jgi:hypothetical protein
MSRFNVNFVGQSTPKFVQFDVPKTKDVLYEPADNVTSDAVGEGDVDDDMDDDGEEVGVALGVALVVVVVADF